MVASHHDVTEEDFVFLAVDDVFYLQGIDLDYSTALEIAASPE